MAAGLPSPDNAVLSLTMTGDAVRARAVSVEPSCVRRMLSASPAGGVMKRSPKPSTRSVRAGLGDAQRGVGLRGGVREAREREECGEERAERGESHEKSSPSCVV
jgi:hypothetical protein